MQEAESAAFASFLQKLGLKTLQEYEASQSQAGVKGLNDRKNTLLNKLEKARSDLALVESCDNSKAI